MNIVFWQNSFSIHQAPLIRALAGDERNNIVVVTETDVSSRRSNMGWGVGDYGNAEVVLGPSDTERFELLEQYRTSAFHVFSGFGVYKATTRTMNRLMSGDHGRIAVVSESWEAGGFRGKARALRYRTSAIRFSKNTDFFLCIGAHAARQFSQLGVPEHKIYPFAYFVDGVESQTYEPRPTQGVELLYVGQLAPWKDPAILLGALERVTAGNWRLKIVGEGELLSSLQRSAASAALADRVTFLPYQSNDIVRTMMRDSDALVLPSRYDGWGAVANEALQAGTRVVISSAAGASQMVSSRMQGWKFQAGDVVGLAKILDEVINSGTQAASERSQLVAWADHSISPTAGARYLEQILSDSQSSGGLIRAPWMAPDDPTT